MMISSRERSESARGGGERSTTGMQLKTQHEGSSKRFDHCRAVRSTVHPTSWNSCKSSLLSLVAQLLRTGGGRGGKEHAQKMSG
jgi:hypothetical protein